MKPIKNSFSYSRPETGLAVIKFPDIQIPEGFNIDHSQTCNIRVPAHQPAGRHDHPRTEILILVSGSADYLWIDSAGKLNRLPMAGGTELLLFKTTPGVPHGVINTGDTDAVFIELANGPQVDVKAMFEEFDKLMKG